MEKTTGKIKHMHEPEIIQFLETKARMTGFLRELYIAKGWIKQSSDDATHYELTSLGEKMLSIENQ